MFAFWFELKHKLNLCLWGNTFREKKWRELFKSKRWEELSSLSFMKRRLFGPTLQFQSSFRCLTLMLSCFSSCVMCFLFFPRRKKKCCAISWFFFLLFLEACLNELMTSATQTICIWRVLFQNEICAVWKKGTPTQAEWLTAKTWRQIVVVHFEGLLVSCVPAYIFTGWIHISTTLDGHELRVFFFFFFLNGYLAFWNESVHMVLCFAIVVGDIFSKKKMKTQ